MAAGQGFKTFTTGEVLTAGDVNGYLMQGINVFTNATARDAAITAPAEGQFAFTKDNNSLWYYDGAAWVASGATGDIEGVTVSSPLTGGGTSGTVNVGILSGTTSNLGAVQLSDSTSSTSTTLAATANAVKTSYDLAAAAIPKSTVTTAGDIIYATGSSAVTRAGIGSTGQVLTVTGGVPTWATPTGSSLAVSQITDVNTLSGTSINITGLSSYDFIQFRFSAVAWNTGASFLKWTINNDTSSVYQYQRSVFVRNQAVVLPTMAYFGSTTAINNTDATIPQTNGGGSTRGYVIILQNCKATGFTTFNIISNWGDSLGTEETTWISGIYKSAAAVSSFQMTTDAGYTFNAGGYTVYGG
jgi:hypothetical protein